MERDVDQFLKAVNQREEELCRIDYKELDCADLIILKRSDPNFLRILAEETFRTHKGKHVNLTVLSRENGCDLDHIRKHIKKVCEINNYVFEREGVMYKIKKP